MPTLPTQPPLSSACHTDARVPVVLTTSRPLLLGHYLPIHAQAGDGAVETGLDLIRLASLDPAPRPEKQRLGARLRALALHPEKEPVLVQHACEEVAAHVVRRRGAAAEQKGGGIQPW